MVLFTRIICRLLAARRRLNIGQIITRDNFIEAKYDVFKKFHQQLAVITCGDIGDFRCMTIGWGAMGNVWGHPGSSITVYVNPARYTFGYMQEKE